MSRFVTVPNKQSFTKKKSMLADILPIQTVFKCLTPRNRKNEGSNKENHRETGGGGQSIGHYVYRTNTMFYEEQW